MLATDVERPESVLANAKGLRFRADLPEGYALVMDVDGAFGLGGPGYNVVDMLFMRVPIDVVWLIDGEVVATKRLDPWTGVGFERADTIVELPAGGAEGVTVGDTVRVVDEGDGDREDGHSGAAVEAAGRG